MVPWISVRPLNQFNPRYWDFLDLLRFDIFDSSTCFLMQSLDELLGIRLLFSKSFFMFIIPVIIDEGDGAHLLNLARLNRQVLYKLVDI